MSIPAQQSVWQLIKDGLFEEACLVADCNYGNNHNVSELRNKIIALLCLARFAEAVALSRKIIEIRNGETDSDFISLGVGYWLMGKHGEAIQSWKDGRNAIYKDAAGGVEIPLYLYYAAIKLQDGILVTVAYDPCCGFGGGG